MAAKKKPRGGASVPCPKCKAPTRVLETRRTGSLVTRNRACKKCSHEFVTEEQATKPKAKKK